MSRLRAIAAAGVFAALSASVIAPAPNSAPEDRTPDRKRQPYDIHKIGAKTLARMRAAKGGNNG
jgi:hypothetical protein